MHSERYKMAVVKRLLQPNAKITHLAKKLKIRADSLRDWKKKYINRFEVKITEISIDEEIEIELDNLIYKQEEDNLTFDEVPVLSFVEVMAKEKNLSQYKDIDKQIIVEAYINVPVKEQGIWLRENGLKDAHIKLWQKEIIKMARKKLDQKEYISQLKTDNKKLQRDLKEAKKVQKELEIMFKLKKKFPSLFVNDEEENK